MTHGSDWGSEVPVSAHHMACRKRVERYSGRSFIAEKQHAVRPSSVRACALPQGITQERCNVQISSLDGNWRPNNKDASTPPTAANMTVVAARHVAHTFRRGSRVTVEVTGSAGSAMNVSRAMNVARYVSTFVWLSGSKMQVASLSAGPQRVAMPSFWRRLMSW